MSERIDVKRIAIVMFAAAFVLAGASAFIGYSGNLVEDVLTGAIVGAVAGLLTCMAICVLGDKLMPEPDIRKSPEGRLTNAIIGGYVGLIATGVLVTIAVTILGAINDRPAPFLWGTLISSLGGWIVGGVLGVLIGVSWNRA